ncbi:prolipoprotein diacylglyceryl transferase [Natrialba swarupiae]|uniref:Uncharacterized protein n=1 Tax=Natrialba swarupiae TaxID=2448032 RepID=A0A5D5ATW3_9EURY|nr:hypothetical protein [Natrialba swarupiae]TYT63000.1 hypothetical protein FYC77_04970 [Natrialba swarupiae]
MTEEHDHDVAVDVSSDDEPPVTADRATGTVRSTVTEGVETGVIPLASGGVLLLSALRSAIRGQLRAIPKGIVGATLLRYGVRKRRSSERTEESAASDAGPDRRGESEPSAEAAAASDRPDSGREGRLEPSDDDAEESRVEFVDEEGVSEPRSRPATDGEESRDPRRTVNDDPVEIDVSEPAMADEVSEATGPDPEQAQPAQTEATEPEPTPTEDAPESAVESDEDDDSSDRDSEADDEVREDDENGEDGTEPNETDS